MSTPNVVVTLSDFTDALSVVEGYLVQLSGAATFTGTTDSSGVATITSVTPGSYVLNVVPPQGSILVPSGIASWRITVTDEAGPLDANDLVNSGQGYAAPVTGLEVGGKTLTAGTGITLTESDGGDSVAVSVTAGTGVSDTAYNATSWNDVTTVAPSKNAVRDKFVTVDAAITAAVSDTAYDATSWNAVTTIAPSKNAVRDQVEIMAAGVAPSVSTLTDGATVTVTCDAAKTHQNGTVTLGGNRTLAISGAVAGMRGTIIVKQDGGGSRTLALPATSKVNGGGSGAVTLTSAGSSIDILDWFYDGTNYFFSARLNFT